MSGLLVVPYNDSMRLGQGYNSFLHTPCIYNAVDVDTTTLELDKRTANVSQVVTYSSRLVTSISEVVSAMSISAPSSIKNGSIILSGNAQSVDSLKFSQSDINAVVSVKVVNQTIRVKEDPAFKPAVEIEKNDNAGFLQVYGDCYISGFIDGGELHGIVSIKILSASNKSEIKERIKGLFNSSAASDLVLKSGSAQRSVLTNALQETETTISVNWAGGGQIKPVSERWSLDTLFAAASAFPANVAQCPHHTSAILTKYDTSIPFLKWADDHEITLRNYAAGERYTCDLLDTFMEYQNNVALISDVLSRPGAYRVSPSRQAVNIAVEELVQVRKTMKEQMRLIVHEVEELNATPENLPSIMSKSNVEPPELWRLRLPIFKNGPDDNIHDAEEINEYLFARRDYRDLHNRLRGRWVPARPVPGQDEYPIFFEPRDRPDSDWLWLGHSLRKDRALLIYRDDALARAANDPDPHSEVLRGGNTYTFKDPNYSYEQHISNHSAVGSYVQIGPEKLTQDAQLACLRNDLLITGIPSKSEVFHHPETSCYVYRIFPKMKDNGLDTRMFVASERSPQQGGPDTNIRVVDPSQIDIEVSSELSPEKEPSPTSHAALPSIAISIAKLTLSERIFVTSEEHKRIYTNYRLDTPVGNPTESPINNFADCVNLAKIAVPVAWPQTIQFCMIEGHHVPIIGSYRISYEQCHLDRGSFKGTYKKHLDVVLNPGERIIKVAMQAEYDETIEIGVRYVKLWSDKGKEWEVGTVEDEEHSTVVEVTAPGNGGLKGFFGQAGYFVQRMGVIWGL